MTDARPAAPAQGGAQLPAAFVDWWFAPWQIAPARPPHAAMDGVMAMRDGYRLWCAQLQLMPGLPPSFDPEWAAAAGTDPAALAPAARLFGGLLAARAQDGPALATLPAQDRDWCLRVAATQPLACYGREHYAAGDTLALRGQCELACHLEAAFPGLWPRLRLGLDTADAARIGQLLAAMPAPLGAATAARVRRCWLLCSMRASQTCVPG
ncbi:hypothetical protein [Duganella vulcania]|uniref:Uncharacterized protein n=1 Tax=Duganella vulcania TaxID=2692166 RepID=A0A845H1R1_9BURK|nr:hypothetical protein [Duganella vulcania]MYM98639.1 hypothetical protein [Duganella vulcania]